MSDDFDECKARASAWFRSLRDQIVAAFEGFEDSQSTGPFAGQNAGRFEVSETRRGAGDDEDAGGGLKSVMRGGRAFEKVGVNVSTVYGTLGERAQRRWRRAVFRVWPAIQGFGPVASAWWRICRTRMCLRST